MGDPLIQVDMLDGGDSGSLRRAFNALLPGAEVCLCEKKRQGKHFLTVIPEGAELSGYRPAPGTTVLVSSEETEQLYELAKMPVNVITCGLSSKDTISFSSRREQTAVVSLLRQVESCGRICEPMDLPINFSENYGDYPVLAAAAIEIISE